MDGRAAQVEPFSRSAHMATAAQSPAAHRDEFADWLNSPFIRVALYRQHSQWYAVAEDFRIVGAGPTEGEASENVLELVEAYLRSFYDDGLTYEDAWRPVSRREKFAYFLQGLLARGLVRTRISLPYAESSRLLLPVALKDRHA